VRPFASLVYSKIPPGRGFVNELLNDGSFFITVDPGSFFILLMGFVMYSSFLSVLPGFKNDSMVPIDLKALFIRKRAGSNPLRDRSKATT